MTMRAHYVGSRKKSFSGISWNTNVAKVCIILCPSTDTFSLVSTTFRSVQKVWAHVFNVCARVSRTTDDDQWVFEAQGEKNSASATGKGVPARIFRRGKDNLKKLNLLHFHFTVKTNCRLNHSNLLCFIYIF